MSTLLFLRLMTNMQIQPLGTTCQLQPSSFKFEIASIPLAEPHCPCPSSWQWPWKNIDTDVVRRQASKRSSHFIWTSTYMITTHPQAPGEGWSLESYWHCCLAPEVHRLLYPPRHPTSSRQTQILPPQSKYHSPEEGKNKPLELENFSSFPNF